jgi:hypothetical protein
MKESRKRIDTDPRQNAYGRIHTKGNVVSDRDYSKVAPFVTSDIILNNL